MSREAHIWLKIIMHSLIPGLYLIDYTLMTRVEINIRAVLKSSMRKARVHRGRRYVFGGLITRLYRDAGVPKEPLDYIPRIKSNPYVVTSTRGPDLQSKPVLTIAEIYRRDEMITIRMYGLQMLTLRTSGRPTTEEEFKYIERRYPLNDHTRSVLGIGPQVFEPLDNDIPMDVEHQRASSDVESEDEFA